MNFQLSSPLPGQSAGVSLSDVEEVDALEARRWLDQGQAVMIDVREVNEFENERIPGALLLPLSFFEAGHFPRMSGMKVVLHCAVGKRSAAAAKQLMQAGHPSPFSLKGGLNAWKQAGLAVES